MTAGSSFIARLRPLPCWNPIERSNREAAVFQNFRRLLFNLAFDRSSGDNASLNHCVAAYLVAVYQRPIRNGDFPFAIGKIGIALP